MAEGSGDKCRRCLRNFIKKNEIFKAFCEKNGMPPLMGGDEEERARAGKESFRRGSA